MWACAALGGSEHASGARRTAPEALGPLRPFTPQEWNRIYSAQRVIRSVARRRGLSPSLVNGLIWVESKFKRRVGGRRGPRGLMQLMPRTSRAMARRLGRKYAPNSPDFNVDAGIAYLMLMYERFDQRLDLALAAYNAGPGPVLKWRRAGSPTPAPRRAFVARVERAANTFCVRLSRPHDEPDGGPFTCAPKLDRSMALGTVGALSRRSGQ